MNKGLNTRIIARIIGFLLMIEGGILLATGSIPLLYGETDWLFFAISSAITLGVGLIVFLYGRNSHTFFGKREGYIAVSLVWIIFSLFGMLPFWLSGSIPSVTNAFFETISGFTTTGATSLTNVEVLSHGMLFWRAMTHWLGGMGIIVLSVAIMPMMGIGGMQLFSVESTGMAVDKLSPRIAETARILWGVYTFFTVLLIVLLKVGGMSWFDAVCHAFSAISSGGYSTKNNSIAYWDSPQIEYTLIPFMFISGCNFTLMYYLLHGRLSAVWRNEEFRWYLFVAVGFSILVAAGLMWSGQYYGEKAIRSAFFHTISLFSSTDLTADFFPAWHPFLFVPLLLLMMIGASAGSTAGGIKIIRVVLALKNSVLEFKRLIHPNAVLPVRLNGHAVHPSIIYKVLAFIFLYLVIVTISIFVMACDPNLGLKESFSSVISCISNGGAALGTLASSFSSVSDAGKWYLSFLMLVGRLEIFTVLLIFTPAFWRK